MSLIDSRQHEGMGVESKAPFVAVAILVLFVAAAIAGYWFLAYPA